jgi:hypothetical protein
MEFICVPSFLYLLFPYQSNYTLIKFNGKFNNVTALKKINYIVNRVRTGLRMKKVLISKAIHLNQVYDRIDQLVIYFMGLYIITISKVNDDFNAGDPLR